MRLLDAADELADGDLALDAGEGGAEAEVNAHAEGEVAVVGAGDVEAVGVGKLRGVAVGGTEEEDGLGVLGDDAVGDLDVIEGIAAGELDGRVETEDLLDGGLDQ